MRIMFKNATSGNEKHVSKFFTENGELAKARIKVAFSEKGAKGVEEYLKKEPTFKGTILYVEDNKLGENLYVAFTCPITYVKTQYDQDTGECLGDKEITETHTYLLTLDYQPNNK